MTILQSLFEALESLNGNKLRSGLTILGIVIGVGAVIAMLALGAGAQDTITSSISGIGTNLLFVFRGNADNTNVRNPRPLTLADAVFCTIDSCGCSCPGWERTDQFWRPDRDGHA